MHLVNIRVWCFSAFLVLAAAFSCNAQRPEVLKVEPPSWWAGSSHNPVRLLIRGNGFKGARVRTADPGVRVVGSPVSNERGTYLFVNVAISPQARAGARELIISTAGGVTRAR